MKGYIEQGILPGRFLSAIIRNDFMEACRCADYVNQSRLCDYAKFLYNHAPENCFGSPAKVNEWIAAKAKASEAAHDQ